MHVFVTGGTGTIGSPVVSELLTHGHTVLALARSDASAKALADAGVEVMRGDIDAVDVLRDGVRRTDGVIHLAFDHRADTPAALTEAIGVETEALAAMGTELVGSDRPIVVASGTPWVDGRASTEADPPPTDGPVGGRGRAVMSLLELAQQGVRSAAVRIPRTAHDDGNGGFAGLLTTLARQRGVAGYPGDGLQRWPAVHARDAAVLFRLALESAAPGTSWHAVDEEGVAVRAIAEVIGRRLGLPVRAIPTTDFGPYGEIFAMDQPATSQHTREVFGWAPTHPGLLEDLENILP
ncbi:SDR family oxidoreductase [Mycobacterium yunnanensis]|uniref:SDR family oxidoreductase n=1 Tax=Mycobacterium yunnanensis TaxID=368477 RepID=A0A9X3C5K5_9MYCO|nr:SDR family oxidoreductase [Mycobacterium yunnanensis]MCV7424567.1 SDR family oxidoreductase [Mycobacterium yunnanensis]